MKFLRRIKFPEAAVPLAMLGGGLIIGFLIGGMSATSLQNSIKQSFRPIEEQGTGYSFVHPLLGYRTPEATVLGDYLSLKDELQTTIDSQTKDGTSRAALYFRDLDAGLWIGINQSDTYYPASLLKVPTIIALYKEAETAPSVLNEYVGYDPSILPNVPFDDPSSLIAGRVYSVRDLISHMIEDSDNGATFTLLNRINPEFLHQVYVALGIQDPGDDSATYQISARTYALFFRILYNTTYLSPSQSEEALRLLSKSTFTQGLVAGVPKGMTVAHKYGEHVLSANGNATGVELSDCGIIYYPAHPYLLCVMTSAKDEATATATIAKISQQTYAAVQQRYASTN